MREHSKLHPMCSSEKVLILSLLNAYSFNFQCIGVHFSWRYLPSRMHLWQAMFTAPPVGAFRCKLRPTDYFTGIHTNATDGNILDSLQPAQESHLYSRLSRRYSRIQTITHSSPWYLPIAQSKTFCCLTSWTGLRACIPSNSAPTMSCLSPEKIQNGVVAMGGLARKTFNTTSPPLINKAWWSWFAARTNFSTRCRVAPSAVHHHPVKRKVQNCRGLSRDYYPNSSMTHPKYTNFNEYNCALNRNFLLNNCQCWINHKSVKHYMRAITSHKIRWLCFRIKIWNRKYQGPAFICQLLGTLSYAYEYARLRFIVSVNSIGDRFCQNISKVEIFS